MSNSRSKNLWTIAAAVTLSLALVVVWRATGGDYYTKFEVVDTVNKPIDADDPFAATGFYDDDAQTQTVVRDEFRFGLLPTAPLPFDKHFLALSTLMPVVWLPVAVVLWRAWRKRRRAFVTGRSPVRAI